MSQAHSANKQKSATSFTFFNDYRHYIDHIRPSVLHKKSINDAEYSTVSSLIEPVTISPAALKESLSVTVPSVQIVSNGLPPIDSKINVLDTIQANQPFIQVPSQGAVQSTVKIIGPTAQYAVPYYGAPAKYFGPTQLYNQDDEALYVSKHLY